MKNFKAYSTTFVILLLIFVLLVFIASGLVVKTINRKETKRRFKAIYASYSDALLKTVAMMGGNTGCYYSTHQEEDNDFSNCDEFYKIFVSNLKVQRYCHGKALADGCIPEYESYTTKNLCIGFSREMMNIHNDAFVMLNGSNIIVFNKQQDERRPIFAVDTNGLVKPNKAGEDLFSIAIMKNSNNAYYFHPNVGYCLPVGKDSIENVKDVYK